MFPVFMSYAFHFLCYLYLNWCMLKRFRSIILSTFKVQKSIKGHKLVSGVLHEWESIVNRVKNNEVGERMIICGRAARWLDI